MAARCSRLLALALCLAGLAYPSAAALPRYGCYTPNCQTCQPYKPYQCSVCRAGYEKNRYNVCTPCTKTGQTSSACLTYAVANACACRECKPGYGPTPNLRGQCLPCTVEGCTRFSAACTCSLCRPGYTSDGNGGCAKCTDAGQTLAECQSYQAGTCTCTRCKPGFSLDAATGACIPCVDDQSPEVCRTYLTNTCTCTACKPGYGPVTAGACPQCTDPAPGEECAAYGSVPGQRGTPALGSCACSVCASGYARIYTGDCMQCTGDGQNADACLGFERNSCRCTQCAPKFGPLTWDKRCPPNTCDEAHDATVCKSYKAGVPCFCTACNPGYMLSAGACLPCTDPARDTECLTYSPYWVWGGKGTCSCAVCAPGFVRNYYGDCIPCTGDQAATKCAEYDPNSCRCRKCRSGFGPLNWQRRCPACTNPTASECTEYADTPAPGPGSLGTCSCKTCAAGFQIVPATGDCNACPAPPNCATPESNVCDGCLTCQSGYSKDANNRCNVCNKPNCATFDENTCDCATCKPGFKGTDCLTPCVADNCATPLTNACDGCETCNGGFSLNGATCEDCQKPNCATFTPNTCTCLTCKDGFKGTDCATPCVADNCATPLTNACDGCETCNGGFSLNGATCEDCQKPNCATFTPNTCTCLTCTTDAYTVVEGDCVEKAALTVATTSTLDSGDLTLNVAISNGGTVTATGVALTFTVPSEVTWSATTTAGTCSIDSASGAGTCTLGDLADGGSATVTITGTPTASFVFSGAVAAANVEAADCTSCDISEDITV